MSRWKPFSVAFILRIEYTSKSRVTKSCIEKSFEQKAESAATTHGIEFFLKSKNLVEKMLNFFFFRKFLQKHRKVRNWFCAITHFEKGIWRFELFTNIFISILLLYKKIVPKLHPFSIQLMVAHFDSVLRDFSVWLGSLLH